MCNTRYLWRNFICESNCSVHPMVNICSNSLR
jgi:hypothetical protein